MALGPSFKNDTDNSGCAWQSNINGVNSLNGSKALSTQNLIKSTNQAHDYFSAHLYQTPLTLTSNVDYEYVDTRLHYRLWFLTL